MFGNSIVTIFKFKNLENKLEKRVAGVVPNPMAESLFFLKRRVRLEESETGLCL